MTGLDEGAYHNGTAPRIGMSTTAAAVASITSAPPTIAAPTAAMTAAIRPLQVNASVSRKPTRSCLPTGPHFLIYPTGDARA
jgi:hypothetical protein